MKFTTFLPALLASALFLVGCGGDDPSSSSSEGSHSFCEDDGQYFVFDNDTSLADVISPLAVGVQTEAVRDSVLDLLGANDGYANVAAYSLTETTDYDVMGTLDDPRDSHGQYSKEVTRYSSEKILIGDYSLFENYYDEDTSVEVTLDLDADYQVFRNGFCPSISRYYEIYDFAGVDADAASEKVYDTEAYLKKMNLVDGQALALDLIEKYNSYDDTEYFSTLNFTATKSMTNEEGVVEGDAGLNTHQAVRLELFASYDPSGTTLGETASHSVVIVDGMIKSVRDFLGTYEVIADAPLYHVLSEKNVVYDVETIGAYTGTLLDPTAFTFTSGHPNL